MVLNTYYRALAVSLMRGNPLGWKFKTYNGYEYAYGYNSNNDNSVLSYSIAFHVAHSVKNSNDSNYGVAFGNGTEPVTMDDYKLSGDMITTISSSYAITKEADENSGRLTITYTLINTGSSDITISEIGYFGYVTNNTGSGQTALIEHTLLDTPVTIPAGGVGQVAYTVQINLPI